jgi:cysteine desulfurase
MLNCYYLDYNATTPIDRRVLDSMLPYFKDLYANPSSKYKFAMDIEKDIEKARETIAKCIGAEKKEEIIFTSSATESVNQAVRGFLRTVPEKKHIITSAVEHPAVLDTFKDLKRDGYETTFLSVNKNGEIDFKEFKNSLKENTALVSIIHGNNETGIIFPIEKLSKITKEKNKEIAFHTDATQTIGKLKINLSNEKYKNIDLLSMSGHKIYAPKGIGILFQRRGIHLRKFMTGGHHEFNKRAGTLNTPYIIGLAKAFCILEEEMKANKQNKLKELRDYLEKKLKEKIPSINIMGEKTERLSNTTNVSFDCIEGESLLFQLDKLGFCISSGSACTSGSLDPSHVLRAMHVPAISAHSSIRISLGRYTVKEEIEKFINVMPKIVKKLREISPFWDTKFNKPNEAIIKEAMPAG